MLLIRARVVPSIGVIGALRSEGKTEIFSVSIINSIAGCALSSNSPLGPFTESRRSLKFTSTPCVSLRGLLPILDIVFLD